MAQHRPDNRDRRLALLENPIEHPIEPRRIALRRGHDGVVRCECRAVANREPHIIEFDLAALAGIQRELFEFGAGQQAIAAEMLDRDIGSPRRSPLSGAHARCRG